MQSRKAHSNEMISCGIANIAQWELLTARRYEYPAPKRAAEI